MLSARFAALLRPGDYAAGNATVQNPGHCIGIFSGVEIQLGALCVLLQ